MTDPTASWRVTRDGLIVSAGAYHAMIPFAQFGGLVLAMLRMMKVREGSYGENEP
jgi:hypothetical protein